MKNYQRKQFWQAHNYKKNIVAQIKQGEMHDVLHTEASKFLRTGLLADQRNSGKNETYS
jgi:hypothetical protein